VQTLRNNQNRTLQPVAWWEGETLAECEWLHVPETSGSVSLAAHRCKCLFLGPAAMPKTGSARRLSALWSMVLPQVSIDAMVRRNNAKCSVFFFLEQRKATRPETKT
jgi:hypothetical protein